MRTAGPDHLAGAAQRRVPDEDALRVQPSTCPAGGRSRARHHPQAHRGSTPRAHAPRSTPPDRPALPAAARRARARSSRRSAVDPEARQALSAPAPRSSPASASTRAVRSSTAGWSRRRLTFAGGRPLTQHLPLRRRPAARRRSYLRAGQDRPAARRRRYDLTFSLGQLNPDPAPDPGQPRLDAHPRRAPRPRRLTAGSSAVGRHPGLHPVLLPGSGAAAAGRRRHPVHGLVSGCQRADRRRHHPRSTGPRIINFAQTAIGAPGAALTFELIQLTRVPFLIAFPLGLLLAGLRRASLFDLILRPPLLQVAPPGAHGAHDRGGRLPHLAPPRSQPPAVLPRPRTAPLERAWRRLASADQLPFRGLTSRSATSRIDVRLRRALRHRDGDPRADRPRRLLPLHARRRRRAGHGREHRAGHAARHQRGQALDDRVGHRRRAGRRRRDHDRRRSPPRRRPPARARRPPARPGRRRARPACESLPVAVGAAVAISVRRPRHAEFSYRRTTGRSSTSPCSSSSPSALLAPAPGRLPRRRGAAECVAGHRRAAARPEGAARRHHVRGHARVLVVLAPGRRRATLPGLDRPINLGGVIALHAIVALSLVVLTGWAGQVSLGQFGFAPSAPSSAAASPSTWAAVLVRGARRDGRHRRPSPSLVGLPALRIRGLFLAVDHVRLRHRGAARRSSTSGTSAGCCPTRSSGRRLFFLDFEDERACTSCASPPSWSPSSSS